MEGRGRISSAKATVLVPVSDGRTLNEQKSNRNRGEEGDVKNIED